MEWKECEDAGLIMCEKENRVTLGGRVSCRATIGGIRHNQWQDANKIRATKMRNCGADDEK